MDTRFVQAHKEARWALWLTLLYLAAWLVAAYLPDSAIGITGLPHWFEMACLLVPLIFIVLCWAMVKLIYRDIPLEDDQGWVGSPSCVISWILCSPCDHCLMYRSCV